MLNGPGSLKRGWSLSVLTLVDSEQAAPNSSTPALETSVGPHKDFGILAVPSWLRHNPDRQLELDWWTQLGLSIGCTCGEPCRHRHDVLAALTWGSGGQSLLLPASTE